MAFSATVRGSAYMGPGMRVIYGDWAGASGDTAGSVSIGGKYLGSLWFKNDSTTTNANTDQIFPSVQWNGSIPGTLTVQNQDDVGTGNFIVFTLGN